MASGGDTAPAGDLSGALPAPPRQSVRLLEFFSGIGGMRLAVSDHCHLRECSAFEISPVPNQVYRHNFPGEQVVVKLIEQLKDKDLDGKADLWTMSPPCQPHTTTANALQRDSEDKRSMGFTALADMLPRLRDPPRWILLENVKGFWGSDALQYWKQALRSQGYTWRQYLLNPVALGIPNHRTRYYMVCERSDRFSGEDDARVHVDLSGCSQPPQSPRPASRGAPVAPPSAPSGAAPSATGSSAACGGDGSQPGPSSEDSAQSVSEEAEATAPEHQQHDTLLGTPPSVPAAPTCAPLSDYMETILFQPPSLAPSCSDDDDIDEDAEDSGAAGDRRQLPRDVEGVAERQDTDGSGERDGPQGPSGTGREAGGGGAVAAELYLSEAVLAKPWARGMSYVGCHDRATFCFTKNYGKVMHKSSGSLYYEGAQAALATQPLPRDDMTVHYGRIRFFAPTEILALMGFPRWFGYPPGMSLLQRWRVVGNSD